MLVKMVYIEGSTISLKAGSKRNRQSFQRKTYRTLSWLSKPAKKESINK